MSGLSKDIMLSPPPPLPSALKKKVYFSKAFSKLKHFSFGFSQDTMLPPPPPLPSASKRKVSFSKASPHPFMLALEVEEAARGIGGLSLDDEGRMQTRKTW